jgi:exosortase C (VPDSG-CTERM-specific)
MLGRVNRKSVPLENQLINPAYRLRRFALAVAILACGFAIPLWRLVRFAAASEFYSYILLIPFITLYLLWLKRPSLPLSAPPARSLATVFLLAGGALVAAYWLWLRPTVLAVNDDYLMVMTICFLLLFYGISSLFLGSAFIRVAAFPLAFLILLTPLPPSVIQAVDSFLQNGSAMMAAGFFWLSGTPFLQDGLTFQLPNIKISIAPECSGIHSTVVLFITALLCGHIFLRTPWKRAVLVLFVVPLGLLRNGFRVFVIGQLCIHWGPHMIDSPIHRKGGPIFFMLSLIPLFLVLFLLLKSEKPRPGQTTNTQSQPCAN